MEENKLQRDQKKKCRDQTKREVEKEGKEKGVPALFLAPQPYQWHKMGGW